MNKVFLTSLVAGLVTFVTISDSYAQSRRDRMRNEMRNRNNHNRGTVTRVDRNRPNRNNSTVRRNHSTTTRGPVTRVDRNRPNRNGSTYNPHRTNPHRRYNPPVRTNPTRHYNPNRPHRNHYGTRHYHNPHRYVYRPYRSYRHNPYRNHLRHELRRYNRTRHYYDYLRRSSYNNYLYMNWIFYPSTYSNGYYNIGGYPYFVYNGYQHRYSHYDTCNYQLIDKYNHQVVQNFFNYTCTTGYDLCAAERDRMNSYSRDFRYSCAETFRDQGYNFSYPTYEDDYYDYNY
jgi:hypothetical protein